MMIPREPEVRDHEPKMALYPPRPMSATGMPRNTDHLDFCTSSSATDFGTSA